MPYIRKTTLANGETEITFRLLRPATADYEFDGHRAAERITMMVLAMASGVAFEMGAQASQAALTQLSRSIDTLGDVLRESGFDQ